MDLSLALCVLLSFASVNAAETGFKEEDDMSWVIIGVVIIVAVTLACIFCTYCYGGWCPCCCLCFKKKDKEDQESGEATKLIPQIIQNNTLQTPKETEEGIPASENINSIQTPTLDTTDKLEQLLK